MNSAYKENTTGGNGFVGGEGGENAGGIGTGGKGIDFYSGGISLNGMPGCANLNSNGGEGTGGGSGFTFGTSGVGGYTERCVYDNPVGGYGGGSGASECSIVPVIMVLIPMIAGLGMAAAAGAIVPPEHRLQAARVLRMGIK